VKWAPAPFQPVAKAVQPKGFHRLIRCDPQNLPPAKLQSLPGFKPPSRNQKMAIRSYGKLLTRILPADFGNKAIDINGQDPEMQLSELREYASRRGWTITSEYVDQGLKENVKMSIETILAIFNIIDSRRRQSGRHHEGSCLTALQQACELLDGVVSLLHLSPGSQALLPTQSGIPQ
jgi:hypothetical protein